MGMFDEIQIDLPEMPDGWRRRVLQTKDMDCNLDKYSVGQDRKLRMVPCGHGGSPRPVRYTGEIEAYDFSDTGDSSTPLLSVRLYLKEGAVTSLKGPIDPEGPEFDGWRTLPNLLGSK